MNEAKGKISTMVAAIQQRWMHVTLAWFAITALAAVASWMLVLAAIDNVLMLPSAGLVAGWAVLVLGALGWAAAAGLMLFVRRPNPEQAALLFEQRYPQQSNRLINAVQFLRDPRVATDPLAQAAIIENATALTPGEAESAVDVRPLRDAAIASGIALLLLVLYAALGSSWFFNAAGRILQPFAPPAHFLATTIEVTPGDASLIEGQPLEVSALLGQHLPEHASLEYQVGSMHWASATMTLHRDDQAGTTGRYTFDAVYHPMQYRVRAGRSVSNTFSVAVAERPRVEELHTVITRPAYAGGKGATGRDLDGDITALVGSQIEVVVVASSPLKAATLELSDGRAIDMTLLSGTGKRATGTFTLTGSGSYAIRLTDERDLTNLNPPRYTLTAEPDRTPVALVTRPGRDLILPLNARVDLELQAEDDIGLAAIELQLRRQGGDWQPVRDWPFESTGPKRKTIPFTFDLEPLSLKTGDTLLYRAVARDHREPEPNVGVGHTWSITVSDRLTDGSVINEQTRKLLDALRAILKLQLGVRSDFDMDRTLAPIRSGQQRVRELTLLAIDTERKAVRPTESVITELASLADGPMVQASSLLTNYEGPYEERIKRKPPIVKTMDEIVRRLEALIGQIDERLARAEQVQSVIDQMDQADRDQAMKNLRDALAKLRAFVPEQDKVIEDTEELVRKGENLTDEDLEKIEKLKGTEDKWADIFTDSVKDISKLTEQIDPAGGFHNDYKEMVEQIEAASLNLNPKLIELAVPREQAGREMAESLVEEMEMWLPSSPDHIKWMMEEPLDMPEIPMLELPDQLSDLIGELIEDQDELNDMAEDVTSAWADSIAEGAGWEVADGPISNFSAVGKTGNQLPDNHELSGRAGEGRSGRSQGQMVENVAKGLGGRKTPTRITNDPYEEGVVKELQQMATGGATGGGKARGAGQEGLQGQAPPPLFDDMQYMTDWQQRIRQKAERVAGQLKMVSVHTPDLAPIVDMMKGAEQAGQEGRYAEMFKVQQMVLQRLRTTQDLAGSSVSIRIERAYHLPAEQRQQMLDAMDEPVPDEYQDAVRRYFEQLSETP